MPGERSVLRGGFWSAAAIVLCAGAVWQFAGSVTKQQSADAFAEAVRANWRPAFEANAGQFEEGVRFVLRGPGYRAHLIEDGAVLQGGDGAPLRLRVVGANPYAEVRGERALPGKRHYLLGSDPAAWRQNVSAYEAVRYAHVYPRIDLVYHGRRGALEYDFVLAPGADPADIRLRYEGARLARRADGALIAGEVVQLRPVAYQEIAGRRRPVAVDYTLLAANEVAFRLGRYDGTQPLVIDPVLTFSTALGGGGADRANAVAADSEGATYLAGQTASTDLPGAGARSSGAGTDAFVAKFNAAGELAYATYLGGTGNDIAFALALGADGSAYVTGETASSDFPLRDALFNTTGGGSTDAFVAKLNAGGNTLLYSTYLGGSASDSARAIAVDNDGAAYVGGATASANFPLDAPIFQSRLGGEADGFLTKIHADGVALEYSTYLGGRGVDHVAAVAVNAGREAHVAGLMTSDNMPWVNPLDDTHQGSGDAFIARFKADGSELTFGTYWGGSMFERATGLALDGAGNMYMTGVTNSENDFTWTPGAFQRTYGGGSFDGFVVKVGADIFAEYSTYLGGSGTDQPGGIAVVDDTVYVVGETLSSNFPGVGALQASLNGTSDAFITRLAASGGALEHSTFLGGSGEDGALAAAWRNDILHIAGRSTSVDFPARGITQSVGGGGENAWAARLDSATRSADVAVTMSIVETGDFLTLGVPYTYRSTVVNNGPDGATGIEWQAELPTGLAVRGAVATQGTCNISSGRVICAIGDLGAGAGATVDLEVIANAAGEQTNVARILRADQPDPVPTNNSASASGVVTGGANGGGAWGVLPLVAAMLLGAQRRRSSPHNY